MRGLQRLLVLLGLLTGLVVGLAPAGATPLEPASDPGRRHFEGTIDGADYRVEVPGAWNGTLVLFSHGYYPPQFPPFFPDIALSNRPSDRGETENWLLDQGYAVAASLFQDKGQGFQVANGVADAARLLDWFDANVGVPQRTISTGQSLGGSNAVLLAERYPDRIDGVATVCSAYDPRGLFNAILDVNFAVRTLLTDDPTIELVHVTDPAAATAALQDAVRAARTTPEGRARLALVASFNNLTGWFSPYEPKPTDMTERILQQSLWIEGAVVGGNGPFARADMEPRLGGNPSSNVEVDYSRQLARSSQGALVQRAYREAGLSLQDDLDRLAAAPRIAADPAAVQSMRALIPEGDAGVPMVTLHTTGDAGAVPDQEGWLAGQIRQAGDGRLLRQLWVERGAHCTVSAAEEIVSLQTLFHRLDTGHWPSTTPRRLNQAANALGPGLQSVFDFATGADRPLPPDFTRFQPPEFLRPSR